MLPLIFLLTQNSIKWDKQLQIHWGGGMSCLHPVKWTSLFLKIYRVTDDDINSSSSSSSSSSSGSSSDSSSSSSSSRQSVFILKHLLRFPFKKDRCNVHHSTMYGWRPRLNIHQPINLLRVPQSADRRRHRNLPTEINFPVDLEDLNLSIDSWVINLSTGSWLSTDQLPRGPQPDNRLLDLNWSTD